MKMSLIYGLALTLGVQGVYANTSANQVVTENQALVEAVQQPVIEVVNDPVTTQANSQSTNVTTSVQQPVILQNQPTNQVIQQQPTNNIVVQKQPVTVVEDSPLTESKADALRRKRIELEQQTESIIVEKLESERIRAEQERVQKIVDGLHEKNDQQNAIEKIQKEEVVHPVPHPVVQEVAAPVVQPEPVEPAKVEPIKVEIVKEESYSEPEVQNKYVDESLDKENKAKSNFFVGAGLGFINYNLDNVNSLGALGVNVGSIFDDKYVVEGTYSYARFDIESVDLPGAGYFDPFTGTFRFYPLINEMKQHSFLGSVKYKVLPYNRLSPYIGALAGITYRDYKIIQDPAGASFLQGTGSSWALDIGVQAGADLKMTENFSLNFDFKYLMNASYDVDTDNRFETSRLYDSQFGGEKIEEAGNWQLFIGGRLLF